MEYKRIYNGASAVANPLGPAAGGQAASKFLHSLSHSLSTPCATVYMFVSDACAFESESNSLPVAIHPGTDHSSTQLYMTTEDTVTLTGTHTVTHTHTHTP